MPIFADAPVRLRVHGALPTSVPPGLMSVVVDAEGVMFVPLNAELDAGHPQRLPFERVDGVEGDAATGRLILYLRGGATIEGAGDARAADLAADVARRGRTTPEVARALRSLGATGPGREQDRFFQPLLAARRAAMPGGDDALTAFDATPLREEIERLLAEIAAAREPARPAARRALEARLCDATDPLFEALEHLAAATTAARAVDSAHLLHAWREWCDALRRVFDRADAAWRGVRTELEA